jgi:hypothetical protein
MEKRPKYYNGVEYISREEVPAAAFDRAKHQLRWFAPPESTYTGEPEHHNFKSLQTSLNGPQFPFEDVVDGTNWYDERTLSRKEVESWAIWNR